MLWSGLTLAWMCAAVYANPAHDALDRVIAEIQPKIISSGLDPAPLNPYNIRIKSTWIPTFNAELTNSSIAGLSLLRRKDACDLRSDPRNQNRATAFCKLTTCSMEASMKASIKGDRLLEGSRDIGIKITLALPTIVVVLEKDAAAKFTMAGIFVDSFLHAVSVDGKLDLNQVRREEFFKRLHKNMEEQLDGIIATRYADLLRNELRQLSSVGEA